MMTWLPSRCNDSARPRPIPVPPPVTRMVLPVICMAFLLTSPYLLPAYPSPRTRCIDDLLIMSVP